MKRSNILDALQVTAALLITSGMVVYAAPVPRPVTPVKASIPREVTASAKVATPVVAPIAPIPTPVVVAPTTPVVAVPVAAAPVVAPVPVSTGSHEDMMAAAGITSGDYGYVDYIVSHESGWDVNATNAGSGAHGLPQALPYSKTGCDWSDGVCQLQWAQSYAVSRYGTWYNAYSYWRVHQNW